MRYLRENQENKSLYLYMEEYQQVLHLKTLDSIESIVNSLTEILSYSTPLRNAAYLIQLDDYLSQIPLNKGLGVVHKFNLLRIRADIIENLLYCSLKDFKTSPTNGRIKPGLQKYADIAKKMGMISKSTYKKISIVCSKRNDLHPSRQVVLFTQIDPEIFKNSDHLVRNVIKELRTFCSSD